MILKRLLPDVEVLKSLSRTSSYDSRSEEEIESESKFVYHPLALGSRSRILRDEIESLQIMLVHSVLLDECLYILYKQTFTISIRAKEFYFCGIKVHELEFADRFKNFPFSRLPRLVIELYAVYLDRYGGLFRAHRL